MNDKLKYSILASTLFTLFYAAMPELGLSYNLVFLAFIIANILLFRMVYVILKYGKESSRTFNEHFYDDIDSKRAESSD